MKFAALLFDCDGILVNSEAITLGVLRDLLAERGWVMTLEECTQQFLGRLVRDNAELIATRTGAPVTQAWMDEFLNRRDAALLAKLEAIDGVHDALAALKLVYGTRMACASGADRRKIELQLNKVGLMDYFEARCFSGYEMQHSKPAPDVYLAAAAHFGVSATTCAVIEDSAAGVKAGVASGACVFAYVAADSHPVHAMGGAEAVAQSLRALGAHHVFYDMRELPGLLTH